jgi:hypothetical protein
MPFDCRFRQQHGHAACLTRCQASPVFSATTVARPGDVPPADVRIIDIAVLDMHHGWPNLGHGAIVSAMQNAVCDIAPQLGRAGLGFRVLSYDVRGGRAIPEPPGGRHGLYVGTGGPGHLDPRRNDGVSEGSQGIAEDPAWEAPLFEVFDRIRDSRDAALLGVCHTFGVMCHWLEVADAVLRGPAKGGKSTGVVDNILSDEGLAHPWFARFADLLPDHRHFRVLDNRLYDLVPRAGALQRGVCAVAFETAGRDGTGNALTMIEVARAANGVMPRILGVNHHPEIVNRSRLLVTLEKQFERGDVSRAWYDERKHTLTDPVPDEWGDRLLNLTSSYTFMGPLRYHLYRLARERAETLNEPLAVDEAMLTLTYEFQHAAVRRL